MASSTRLQQASPMLIHKAAPPPRVHACHSSYAGGSQRVETRCAERSTLATLADLPLTGKRIMMTAPRQYAQKLGGLLLHAGARPVWLPAVQIQALQGDEAYMELDAALADLARFSHVAFTSRNGVVAVMERLAHLSGGMAGAREKLLASGAKLCALGADSQALKQYGLEAHVLPQEASTQGLVQELVRRGEASGARVLCPVPLVSGGLDEPPVVPRFIEALKDAGAVPTRVPAYTTTLGCRHEDVCVEVGLLQDGHIDVVAFSSTAEAQGLVLLCGGAEFVTRAVARHGVLLAAHGPYTAAGASNLLGVPVTCVSKNFSSFAGLVTALEQHFCGAL